MAGLGGKRGTFVFALAALVVGVAAGAGGSLLFSGYWKDWYAFRDPVKLPASPGNDLIRYGYDLVLNTAQHIGPEASDASMRFAGNDLACTNCHLNAGLQKFAGPYVSTFATYPMMVSDKVETLRDRINGCMIRSMNGKPMPEDSREMNALIAYIQYVGAGTPEGVRVAGMGMLPVPPPAETPDAARGATVFSSTCTRCHGADGQGQRRTPPDIGYSIPPLWGDNSFNAAAGMADIHLAAAFIRANMPRGITYQQPILTVQQAWDVAAFVTGQPRPPGPPSQ